MAHEPADPRDPDGYRELLERRAREAAYAQQRAGTVFRWVVVVFGAVAALGGLVLIGMTTENRP